MKKISKKQIVKIAIAVLVLIVVGVSVFLISGKQTGSISKGNNKQYNNNQQKRKWNSGR